MNQINMRILQWVGLLISGVLFSGCSGAVSAGTSTPVIATSVIPSSLSGATATPLAASLTATVDLSPLQKALHELYAGDFHFVYTSTEKRAEGDANLGRLWFQYTVTTASGTDGYGSVNGDWIVVYRSSLFGYVSYHYVSGKWVSTGGFPKDRDIAFFDLIAALSIVEKASNTKPSTLQLVGTEQVEGQACLHYKDTDPVIKNNSGDVWVSINGNHLIQIVSQVSNYLIDPNYKVGQIQVVFSNFGVPFTRKANVPPSN